jgi:hypothetical protein
MICDGLQKQANKRTHKQSINQTNSQTNRQPNTQTNKQTSKRANNKNAGFRVLGFQGAGFRVLRFRVLGSKVLFKVCGVVLLFRVRRFCFGVGKVLLWFATVCKNKQTNERTHNQSKKQTHKQKNKQTNKHTNKQTNKQRVLGFRVLGVSRKRSLGSERALHKVDMGALSPRAARVAKAKVPPQEHTQLIDLRV